MKKSTNILSILMIVVSAFSTLSAAEMEKPKSANGQAMDRKDYPGVYLEAGLILEQMYFFNNQAALFYEETQDTAASVTVPAVFNNASKITYNFNLDPGLHVGLSTFTYDSKWKINMDFEWLYSKVSVSKTAGDDQFYYPFTTYSSSLEYNILSSWFKINYYVLDLVLSRGAFESKNIKIEPFGGIKVAWLYMYNSANFTDTVLPAANPAYETRQARYTGIGPEFGLNVEMPVAWGFSIYNDTNLSILIGNTRNRSNIWIDLENNATTPANASSYNYNAYAYCPTFRTCLGLMYDHDFKQNEVMVNVKAGFDARYYFNQYPLVGLTGLEGVGNPEVTEGSFGLIGLIVTAGISF